MLIEEATGETSALIQTKRTITPFQLKLAANTCLENTDGDVLRLCTDGRMIQTDDYSNVSHRFIESLKTASRLKIGSGHSAESDKRHEQFCRFLEDY